MYNIFVRYIFRICINQYSFYANEKQNTLYTNVHESFQKKHCKKNLRKLIAISKSFAIFLH